MGVTINEGETEIVDFGRQQVTVIDTVRRKYATFPASEYGSRMAQRITDEMPEAPGMEEMLKSMKTTCETKDPGVSETIQGVQAVEHDVTCTMTMSMPAAVQELPGGGMSGMSMKTVMRTWSAAPSERLRVPGLWQLSGFEVWEKYFMNPAGALGKMEPEAMKPMLDAMQKDQSVTLREAWKCR